MGSSTSTGNTTAGELSGAGAGGYGPDRVCGAVSYTYDIGKYEVTAGQYAEFLNAVAAVGDAHGLYNTDMGGGWNDIGGISRTGLGTAGDPWAYAARANRGNRPIGYVSWGDAARFANWLHNGQPSGLQELSTTEDGSYYLNGATSDAALLAVSRELDANWVIPSEDEWYKAAYHQNDGVTGNYFGYPTSNDSTPTNVLSDPNADPGNNANFWVSDYTIGSPYYRTEVGDFENSESPYGTFDQGGNVWEWDEAVIDTSYRGVRGGSIASSDYSLHASDRNNGNVIPTYEAYGFGFRVAQVPEPATMGLLTLGGFALICRRHKKGRVRPVAHATRRAAKGVGLALVFALLCLACHGQADAGEIVSWGYDGSGLVTDTPSGDDFVAIAAGGAHSLALRTDGSVVAWGSDTSRQLSDAPGGLGFTAIAAGEGHSLALTSDGSIASWGDNRERQVSDAPSGSGFVAIAAGSSHSLALKSDGSIMSWGHDNWSQVTDTPSAGGGSLSARRKMLSLWCCKTVEMAPCG